MMNIKVRIATLLAGSLGLAGLLVGTPAQAIVSAEAKISNIVITLTDLDPADAITPSLSFDGTTVSGVTADPLAGYPFRSTPDPIVFNAQNSDFFRDVTSASAVLPGNTASASTTSNSFSTNVSTTSGAVQASAFSAAHFVTEQGQLGFTLTPTSAFTVTGDAFVRASSDGISTGLTYCLNSHAGSSAYFSISEADGFSSSDPTYVQSWSGVETPWQVPTTLEDSRQLTLTFSNPTDKEIHGHLVLYTTANATEPVPEPQTYALMLAGIGLLACIQRRKSKPVALATNSALPRNPAWSRRG